MSLANSPYGWPEGKRCAFVFSVDVDIESPLLWRTRGQELRGFGELEQRRFGERIGIERLLDLQQAFGIKASYYVPGYEARSYPWLLPTLTDKGHEVGLHGYHHELVNQLNDDENAAILDRCIQLFQEQGVNPVGYRSPAWELTAKLPEQLRQRGIRYDSSLMGYDHPYTVNGLTEVPVQWLLDDAIYFKFSGGGLDKWHPAAPRTILESWLEEWKAIYEFGGLFMLTVHPWISGKGQRIRLLRKLLKHVTVKDDVWFATAQEVAAHHKQTHFNRFEVTLELAKMDDELA